MKTYGHHRILGMLCTLLFAVSVQADPPVNPGSIPPAGLFCIKLTGADKLPGGGIRAKFETLNWTDRPARQLSVTVQNNPVLNTGGLLGGVLTAPMNDWTNTVANPNAMTWVSGTPQPFIDIDPNNDGSYADAPPLPVPVDSGPNKLDGFIVELPSLNPFERVVLNWRLLDAGGAQLAPDNGGFSFGIMQIDRALDAANGNVRVSMFPGIRIQSQQITDIPPLNQSLTQQNATEVPPIGNGSLAVPSLTEWAILAMVFALALIAVGARRVRRTA